MQVLIYKRTHPGDPNADGAFGCEDCMGTVRKRRFDAVIGVGGIGPEAQSWGIDRRLNWVGVGAHPSESIPLGFRGPLVTFDRFLLLEDQGPELQRIAPVLARYMYATHRRIVMSERLGPTYSARSRKSCHSRLVFERDQLRDWHARRREHAIHAPVHRLRAARPKGL